MKKLVRRVGLLFLSSALISFVIPAVALPSPPSDQTQALGDARLSLIQGDVAIQTGDTGNEWGAAAINTPLVPGTKIWDPEKGRAEIQFFDGSYLRAGENTEVDITNLSIGSNGDVIQVGVPEGRSYIHYAGSDVRDSVFQVDTPVTSIMAYGPSRFQVDTYGDGTTEVTVHRGSVYVQSQNGETQVDAGTMLSIDSNQHAELSAMRPEDSWLAWNFSRDSRLARAGESRRYLPASLDVYGDDFDSYGRWVDTADYGFVWAPTGLAVDWAPYRLGRWCWIGGDYVWVSYEPWGWAPYHYGRWAFIRNTGWCWVPPASTDVYWGPGFVAWINTPTYVSWVPLAPREIYYGHGYYGPHSVNVTNVNINRVNITNVYVNARVSNAVTVVNHETFLTGRPERLANAPRNPFAAGVKPSIGRPDVKPVRATAFPNPVKVISEKKLPSREIVTRAEKIRNRPVAVHKDVSVFKPGERANSMRVNRVERPKPITSVQRGEAGKAPAERREVGPPPVQRGQPAGPSTQREFGVAPQRQGPANTPPPQRREINPPGQVSKPVPPVQRKEAVPPYPRREQPGAPPTQREFGVAPQHQGPASTPPPQRREINPPGQMSEPAPPVQRKEAAPPSTRREQPGAPPTQREVGVAPQYQGPPSTPPPQRKEINPPGQMSKPAPPVQRKEAAPPSTRREQPGAPPTQREFGVAPQHQGPPSTPPPQRKEFNSPRQMSAPTPSASRPQPNPPAQMARPVPSAPKGPSGPAVQRNMGTAPPHAGQPTAPPAQSRPQGASSATPSHKDAKEKDKR